MAKYITKKVAYSIVIMFIATICIFFMVKATGINPVLVTLRGGGMTEETLNKKMESYGLNQPVAVQYLNWLKNILSGNFGESIKSKVPVAGLLKTSLPITLGLAISSFILSQIVSISLGVIAAVNQGKAIDKLIVSLTVVIFSVPIFFLGLLSILFLSKNVPDYSYTGAINTPGEYVSRLFVPVIIMTIGGVALLTKVTRQAMITQLKSDYVIALRARGIPEWRIVTKHALKNSLIPIITISGIQFGAMLAGAVMVENLFSLNGIGKLMVQGVSVGDVSVIQAVSLIIIAGFLLSNLAVEILYVVIDPRVKEQEAEGGRA